MIIYSPLFSIFLNTFVIKILQTKQTPNFSSLFLSVYGNNLIFAVPFTIKHEIDMKQLYTLILIFAFSAGSYANRHIDLVVAQDGSGNYLSLTEAIENLPMYQFQRFVILIKNGVYNEKIRIEQDNLTLLGESRDSTIIQYSQLRTDWIESKDWIGPAVINIHADDVVLENLTIENSQPEVGPHAFTIYGTGTRTIIQNCNVKSKGGDTVSLWNFKNGMYYHANCYFEGAVDFVCPRGWCYIRDSEFYEVKKTAAIWHAAPENKEQKFVLENCTFNGVEGFYLGRHHYEAQFYLLNCHFPENMINKPIYLEVNSDPSKNRPYFWGDRYYFYNCTRTGGNYEWFANNVQVDPELIDPEWTFDGRWNPESTTAPVLTEVLTDGRQIHLIFNEKLTIRGKLKLMTESGKELIFKEGEGRDRLRLESIEKITLADLKGEFTIVTGEIIATEASAMERKVDKTFRMNNFKTD